MMTRFLNPLLALVLRTPAGRLVKPFAALEFAGRRTGKRYQMVVGWHQDDDGVARVFSPAAWRANFAQPADAVVRYGGRKKMVRGTLVKDPDAVAAALNFVLSTGVAPRMLGFQMADGHRLTTEDVSVLRRAMIEFQDAAG
jgi:hypothetical protein